MAFYRKLTRQRTINSILEFDTTDNGLKHSMLSFAKSPRVAQFFNRFEIREDYCASFENYNRGLKLNRTDLERSASIKIPKRLLLRDIPKEANFSKESCLELKKLIHIKAQYYSEEKCNSEEKCYNRVAKDDGGYEQDMVHSASPSSYMDYKSQDSSEVAMKSARGREGEIFKTGRERDMFKTLQRKQKSDNFEEESELEADHSSESNELYKASCREWYSPESLSSPEEDLDASFPVRNLTNVEK